MTWRGWLCACASLTGHSVSFPVAFIDQIDFKCGRKIFCRKVSLMKDIFRWLLRANIKACIISMSAITSFNSWPQSEANYEILRSSETSTLLGRLRGEPLEGRWAFIELQSIVHFRENDKMWLQSHSTASIDCRNKGFERIIRFFNLETDGDKPPKWAQGPESKKYEKGFPQKTFKHREVSQFVAAEFEEMSRNVSENERRGLSRPGSNWRSDEEVAVDFACAVIKGGMSSKEAAILMNETLGLTGVKTLSCVVSGGSSGRTKEFELTVRFHEPTGYVKVQDEWKLVKTVNPDRIHAKHKSSDLSISRLTGRAKITWEDGLEMNGSCEAVKAGRKF